MIRHVRDDGREYILTASIDIRHALRVVFRFEDNARPGLFHRRSEVIYSVPPECHPLCGVPEIDPPVSAYVLRADAGGNRYGSGHYVIVARGENGAVSCSKNNPRNGAVNGRDGRRLGVECHDEVPGNALTLSVGGKTNLHDVRAEILRHGYLEESMRVTEQKIGVPVGARCD